MRKEPASARGRKAGCGPELFPPAWPWRAWPSFEQDLLAAVYAKSGDLWQVLRDSCRHVTGGLQHLEYEGELERESSFDAAMTLIPRWASAEAPLQQARTLLGRELWDSLTSRAAAKAMEGPVPGANDAE